MQDRASSSGEPPATAPRRGLFGRRIAESSPATPVAATILPRTDGFYRSELIRRSEAYGEHLVEYVSVQYWRFYGDGRWMRCVSQNVALPFWDLTERDGAGAKETITSGTFAMSRDRALTIVLPSMSSDPRTSLADYRWTIDDERLMAASSGLPDHLDLSFVSPDGVKPPVRRALLPRRAPAVVPPVESVPETMATPEGGAVPAGPPMQSPIPSTIVTPEPPAAVAVASIPHRRLPSLPETPLSVPPVDSRLLGEVPPRSMGAIPSAASTSPAAPAGGEPESSATAPRVQARIPEPAQATTAGPSEPAPVPIPMAGRVSKGTPEPAPAPAPSPVLTASRDRRAAPEVALLRSRKVFGGAAISLSAVPLILLWAHAWITSLHNAMGDPGAGSWWLTGTQGAAGLVAWAGLLWVAWKPPPADVRHARPISGWVWLGVASMFVSPHLVVVGLPTFLLAAIALGRRSGPVRGRSSWKRPLLAMEATAAAAPCVLVAVGGLPMTLWSGAAVMPDGATGAGLPGVLVALAVALALQQYIVLIVSTIGETPWRSWFWLALPGIGLAIQVAIDSYFVDPARLWVVCPILLATLHFVGIQLWRARRQRRGASAGVQPVC